MLKLILLRGASGSGKSSLTKTILSENGGVGVVLSSDNFFVNQDGVYQFDGKQLGQAHEWNLLNAQLAMNKSITPIIIDNTHVQRWEAKPYVQYAIDKGYTVEVREPTTSWWIARDSVELARRNTHNVSKEVIERMLERWEDDFTVESILSSERPSWLRVSGQSS
ncbi:hypothetical protein BC833DRAFT_606728 [Globomyces pollinis-pini]|nr:hypothetical protein BC833DRAFT_606728 [Globomyces pollinis-pini]KAJ2991979.1 NEDD4-binding protein 2 [Globomyces sp. JEL0801]